MPCLRTCDVDKRPSRPGTRVAPVGLGWLASRRLQCLALRVLNVTFRPFNRPMRKHLLLSGWSPRRPERRKPICKRSDDWDPSAVRLAYQRRFLLRQMSSTDLPTPAIPEGHDTKMCIYCSKVFLQAPSAASTPWPVSACRFLSGFVAFASANMTQKTLTSRAPIVALALLLRRPGVGTARCARGVEKRLVSV